MDADDMTNDKPNDAAAEYAERGRLDIEGEDMPLPDDDASGDKAAPVDIAPLRSESQLAERLDDNRNSRAVAIDNLPCDEDRTPALNGWGSRLNETLGGLRPGMLWAVGANGAGVGKTAFVAQLADGLALRSAELEGPGDEPLTPVVWLSEMSAAELTERTLARWLDVSLGAIGGAGKFYGRELPRGAEYEDNLAEREHEALEALAGWRGMVRDVDPARIGTLSGGELLRRVIEDAVLPWQDELAQAHRRPVWPVLVIDPVQRFLDRDSSPVEAQDKLADDLARAARRYRLAIIASSDTNKAGATSKAGEEGRGAGDIAGSFRGSYVLQHTADAVIHLERESEPGTAETRVGVSVVKNRRGTVLLGDCRATFQYAPATGRFYEVGGDAW